MGTLCVHTHSIYVAANDTAWINGITCIIMRPSIILLHDYVILCDYASMHGSDTSPLFPPLSLSLSLSLPLLASRMTSVCLTTMLMSVWNHSSRWFSFRLVTIAPITSCSRWVVTLTMRTLMNGTRTWTNWWSIQWWRFVSNHWCSWLFYSSRLSR